MCFHNVEFRVLIVMVKTWRMRVSGATVMVLFNSEYDGAVAG
jgi:hypothetical protein